MSMYCDAKICEICPELTTSQVDRCCKDGSVTLLTCDTERMRIVTPQSIPQSFFSDCLELLPKQFNAQLLTCIPARTIHVSTPKYHDLAVDYSAFDVDFHWP